MSQMIELAVKSGKVSMKDGNEIAVGQIIKVGLGSFELRKTQKAGLHMVRFSGNNNFIYTQSLNSDGRYRLGAKYGFRVTEVEEEPDPIKKVLRTMDIPVSHLVVMKEGEIFSFSAFTCDIWRNYHEGTTTNRLETDGQQESQVTSSKRVPGNQYCGPEVHSEGQISGATWAIEIVHRMHTGGVGSYVGRIVVWPGCNPVELANKLAPYIYGEHADADYPAALQNFELAQKWLLKFGIKASSEKSDTLILEAVGEKHTIGGACNL